MGNYFSNKPTKQTHHATGINDTYKLLSDTNLEHATIHIVKITNDIQKLIIQHPSLQKLTITTLYGSYLNHIIYNSNLKEIYLNVKLFTKEEIKYLFENIQNCKLHKLGLCIDNVTNSLISILSESLYNLGIQFDITEDIYDNQLNTIIVISKNSPIVYTYNILEKNE